MSRIQPPQFGPEIFDLTMKGLEAGLRVGDIATYGLMSCAAGDDAAIVMQQPEYQPFDCVPVTEGDRVIGVLLRDCDLSPGPARERMRHLDDGLLVSSDEPLKGFIPLLVQTPHRLVLRGSRIDGIVTSSDVHKLPVRLLAFALITHLEMTMAAVITQRWAEDEWFALLSSARQLKVHKKFDALKTENFDPPLIEVTDFCDKRTVLAKQALLDLPSKKQAIHDFKRIEVLRNSVAHAGTYARSDAQLADFARLIRLTEEWIERLSPDIKSGGIS